MPHALVNISDVATLHYDTYCRKAAIKTHKKKYDPQELLHTKSYQLDTNERDYLKQ